METCFCLFLLAKISKYNIHSFVNFSCKCYVLLCREPVEPHQLHFDMREAALRQGLDNYRLEHPVSLLLVWLYFHWL